MYFIIDQSIQKVKKHFGLEMFHHYVQYHWQQIYLISLVQYHFVRSFRMNEQTRLRIYCCIMTMIYHQD